MLIQDTYLWLTLFYLILYMSASRRDKRPLRIVCIRLHSSDYFHPCLTWTRHWRQCYLFSSSMTTYRSIDPICFISSVRNVSGKSGRFTCLSGKILGFSRNESGILALLRNSALIQHICMCCLPTGCPLTVNSCVTTNELLPTWLSVASIRSDTGVYSPSFIARGQLSNS